MTKETRLWLASLLMPLVLAVAAWINAHAEKTKRLELADGYQEYVEMVMRGEECPPCEAEE